MSRLVKRRFERAARHTGLPITRRQAAVLLYIARKEGVSQAEVATWLDIEPIALVRMLDKLNEEGLVERRAHPTDRRVRTLWLMPAARPVVERILEINLAIREEAFAGLNAGNARRDDRRTRQHQGQFDAAGRGGGQRTTRLRDRTCRREPFPIASPADAGRP